MADDWMAGRWSGWGQAAHVKFAVQDSEDVSNCDQDVTRRGALPELVRAHREMLRQARHVRR